MIRWKNMEETLLGPNSNNSYTSNILFTQKCYCLTPFGVIYPGFPTAVLTGGISDI